jgi:hypothetical protein
VEAQRADDTEEHDALGWTAFEEAQEPSDAMTIIGVSPRDEAAEPEPEPAAQADVEAEAPPEPEPAAEPVPAEEPIPDDERPRRWWRRRSHEEPKQRVEPPSHVRVLAPDEADPWEQGFDEPVPVDAARPGDAEERTEDDVLEEPARRLFRRR